jgi:hypothetical protein
MLSEQGQVAGGMVATAISYLMRGGLEGQIFILDTHKIWKAKKGTP